MPMSLVVRDLDEETVILLKQQAARHDRTIEAELRAILKDVLRRPARLSFTDILSNMPNVGRDDDFDRNA